MKNNKMFRYEYKIQNSTFISLIYSVNNIDEFKKIFNKIKQENKKSTHICWAYEIEDNGINYIKYFDDGEPKGTAGLPIYSLIKKNNLKNIACFVVRYFGGKKLGSGKLYRSYIKSTNECLKLFLNQKN